MSLIELLVAIVLLAILGAMAAPAMGNFAAARRVEDVARRLAEDMHTARSEAVKRNTAVLLCADASITSSTCKSTPAAADWAKGWRLCVDRNGDGSCDTGTTADPNPLRVGSAVAADVTFTGPTSRLRFNASGSVTAASFTDFSATHARATGARWTVRFAASGALSARKS